MDKTLTYLVIFLVIGFFVAVAGMWQVLSSPVSGQNNWCSTQATLVPHTNYIFMAAVYAAIVSITIIFFVLLADRPKPRYKKCPRCFCKMTLLRADTCLDADRRNWWFCEACSYMTHEQEGNKLPDWAEK
jgi:hypothetical protein